MFFSFIGLVLRFVVSKIGDIPLNIHQYISIISLDIQYIMKYLVGALQLNV